MAIEGHEGHQVVFIVRLARHPAGRVSGVVERVRTGEKARFTAVEEVGPLLAALLAREEEKGSRTAPSDREGRS